MQVAGAELTLERWLSDCGASESLSEVVLALGGACMDVAERVRTASCDSYSCFNEHHSDERMSGVAIDLVAEQLMVDALRGTGCVAAVSTPLDPLGCLDPAGQYSEDVDLVQQRQRRERLSGSVPAAVPADLGSRRGTASPRWPERCVVTGGRAALGVLSASVDPLHGASPPPPGAPTARAAALLTSRRRPAARSLARRLVNHRHKLRGGVALRGVARAVAAQRDRRVAARRGRLPLPHPTPTGPNPHRVRPPWRVWD